jgi:proteasome lid subunit RPN8/RPN11
MTSVSPSSERAADAQEQRRAGASPDRQMGSVEKRMLFHGRRAEAGSVQVAFGQIALRQLEGHCGSDLTHELGGALLGHVHQVGRRYDVNVTAVLPVETSDHGPIHFTFTADTWSRLQEDRSERYPALDVVGWYHTHPGLGVFFSADDVVVQSAAFVMPWQVALVVDPVVQQAGLFAWAPGTDGRPSLTGLPGFHELLELQQTSVTPWTVVTPAVHPELSAVTGRTARLGRVSYPPSQRPSLPPISPWWGVVLGGTSLLITLILLLDRLLSSPR